MSQNYQANFQGRTTSNGPARPQQPPAPQQTQAQMQAQAHQQNLYRKAAQNVQPFYPNVRVCKTDIASTGEAVQLVRPMASEPAKPTDQIVSDLVNRYDYKKNQYVRATENDLSTIERAFGANLKDELLNSYDGSAIISDNQQDLIGERYIAEQIKRINEKKTSVVDRYAHLLYEGEKEYKPVSYNPQQYIASPSTTSVVNNSQVNLSSNRPLQHQQYILKGSKVTQVQRQNN